MKIILDTKRHSRAGGLQGFSLFELLMTIAIFGILAALAVASLGDTTSAARMQKDKRNAQLLAGLASTANAAGASFVVAGDEQATILKLFQGCSPTQGIFKGRVFKFPTLSGEDLTGAMTYLALNGEVLQYQSTGDP